jgi:hypothetical protein
VSVSNVPHITQNFARPSYRPQEPSGLDPEMRRMAIIAAGFGAVLAAVIGAVSFSGPARHHGIPVIAPPDKPVRIKPEHPGGLQVVGADDVAAPGTERLAPPPEKPAIRALRAKKTSSVQVRETAPKVVAPPPKMVVAAAPAIPPILAAPIRPASLVTGGTAVQLAAFESEQAAQQDWGKMAEKMPKLFDGHKPVVERAHLAGHTLYRLRTGGFANLAAATAFCGEVRAKGGDCSIAAF